MWFRFAAIAIFVSPVAAFAQNTVFHYGPEVIEVSGVVERQTFPGKPGYYSIKDGDEVERGWYFRLDESIDVEKTPTDEDPNAETERNIKVLQLTWDDQGLDSRMPKVSGKKMKLKGYLFHGFNGHHHTRVLMWVDRIEEFDR